MESLFPNIINISILLFFKIDIKYYKNRIKVKIAVVRGKKSWDKRQSIKERDVKRELQRNER